MIQRIQSLWLLLVTICGVLVSTLPTMRFFPELTAQVQHLYEFRFFGMWDVSQEPHTMEMSVWALACLEVIIPLLSLVTIFLFRHRIVQARLCVVNVMLMVGYYVALAVYTWAACSNFSLTWHPTIWTSLFLVGIVLTMMAIRSILRDEALVRAADRLR